MVEWLKKAPTGVVVTVIITCGVIVLGLLGTYVALTLDGADTTEFRQWINTLGQILVYPFLGVGTLAAISAAKSANKADEQTNGHLTAKDEELADLRAQLAAAKGEQ
jgi:fructose-specific phosphotransferase system IIC component